MTAEPLGDFLAAMLDAEAVAPNDLEPQPEAPYADETAGADGPAGLDLGDVDLGDVDLVAAAPADPAAVDELDRLMASIEIETAQSPVDPCLPAPVAAEEKPDVCILFLLAGAQYAIPITQALEMDVLPPITPVPFAADWIRGVTNRRGEILPVVDLRLLLGFESGPAPGRGTNSGGARRRGAAGGGPGGGRSARNRESAGEELPQAERPGERSHHGNVIWPRRVRGWPAGPPRRAESAACGSSRLVRWTVRACPPTIDRDWESALTTKLAEIKKEFSDETKATFNADAVTPYDIVVKTLDAMRTYKDEKDQRDKELFPDVVFAAGIL